MSQTQAKKLRSGTFLIAEPYMLDPNFKRSVVLLCEHRREGSIGFILNKSLKMNICDLMSTFPKFDAEVYYGGPVEIDTIHYIHTRNDLLKDARPIIPGLYWGGDFATLKELVYQGRIKSSEIKFFVGYSGWDQQQLEAEMKDLAWISKRVRQSKEIMKVRPEKMWRMLLENMGGHFRVLAQMDVPVLN